MTVVVRADDLRGMVGRLLGFSDWCRITQEHVDRFAEATGDDQWIHVDPERAATGRFGGPIAHGFLVLSLVSRMLPQILVVEDLPLTVNYGTERVRFLAPVRVGAELRSRAKLDAVEEVRDGLQLQLGMVLTTRDPAIPVCVARVVMRSYR